MEKLFDGNFEGLSPPSFFDIVTLFLPIIIVIIIDIYKNIKRII